MAKYGWIVAVERASHLDSGEKLTQAFTVNLVRPWCDQEVDPAQMNGGRGPELQHADTFLGELLTPWKWAAVEWDVYGAFPATAPGGLFEWRSLKADINPSINDPLLKPPKPPKNADAALEKISAEVILSTSRSRFPFSQAIEDLQGSGGTRSHVHALAPLTHWPAMMSGSLLQVTWFLECKAALLVDCQQIVCFPKFAMKASTGIPAASRLEPSTPRIGNAIGSGVIKMQLVADYNEAIVAFAGLAAQISAPVAPPVAVQPQGLVLTQGAPSRSAMISLLASNLLPLKIISRWIEMRTVTAGVGGPMADPVLRTGLVRAIWRSMGIGFEYEIEATGNSDRIHLIEFLVGKDRLSDAAVLRGALKGIPSPTDKDGASAFKATFQHLNGHKLVPQVWNADQKLRWKTAQDTLEALNNLNATVPATTPEQALAQEQEFTNLYLPLLALMANDEGICEFLGPWFANILDTPLKSASTAWKPVKDRLLKPGAMRLDLLARVQAGLISQAQWDAARATNGGIANAADVLVKVSIAAIEAVVGADAWAILAASGIEAAARDRVTKFMTDLQASGQSKRARPRDRGIKLDFSSFDVNAGITGDQQLRGYAIALCSGYTAAGKWNADTSRAAWLTDTAMRIKGGDWLLSEDNQIAWMHEAVGSTLNDGQRVVSVEYDGAPLATALSVGGKVDYIGEDPDGFTAVDFAWHESGSLPLLGYGLHYGAVATAVDNAGAIVDSDFRGSHVAQLRPAAALAQWSQQPVIQYLSSEPPGAPVLGAEKSWPTMQYVPPALYALSEDTQAHAFQAHEISDSSEIASPEFRGVALLAYPQNVGLPPQPLFPDAKARCVFEVSPPGTHFAFIERWLNTDRLLLEKDDPHHLSDLSDEKFKGLDSVRLKDFAQGFKEEKVKKKKQGIAYHPAISAIGIEVFAPGEPVWTEIIPIARTSLEAGRVVAAQPRITVDVVADEARKKVQPTKTGQGIEVKLPQGKFVRIRFFSLVSDKHFGAGAGTPAQRYASDLDTPKTPSFTGYRAFGPAECWFETLPLWTDKLLPADKVKVELSPPEETSSGLLSPNLLTASIKFEPDLPWANWIKGVHAQRHEWHWTGYPLELPGGSEINAWLPSLAGVQSFREVIDFNLPTSFTGMDWTLGNSAGASSVFHRWALAAGARPAKYTAYFARPMLRFRRWLNPKLYDAGPVTLEVNIYACGSRVPGRMPAGPAERLPAPALRHAIPLTATYSSTSSRLSRESNGVMLVFDDALKRTDDFARVGGVGDTLEIDLVETREERWSEIGTNPIMHGLELPAGLDRPTVEATPAFGLTFDIGLNPKVAQTAVIVRPVNSAGRWMLAKVRTRRLILPETELGTLLHPDTATAPALPGGLKQLSALPTRRQGEEMVPADITIDVAQANADEVQIVVEGVASPFKIKLPVAPADLPPGLTGIFRYLLSWHKARWSDGGAARWRCQTMLQRRAGNSLEWTTLPVTVRGFQNAGSELPETATITRCWLVGGDELAGAEVRRVRLSDYTEPSWLTFIGSFDQAKPGMGRDYEIHANGNVLSSLQLAEGATGQPPELRSLSASLGSNDPRFHLLLVFRPVPDVTRMQTSEESGALVGAYFPDGNSGMKFLPHFPGQQAPADLSGCHAHVVTFQRITALSGEETADLTKAATLSDLLDLAFPQQPDGGAKESLVRMLPEFIGPIPITFQNS